MHYLPTIVSPIQHNLAKVQTIGYQVVQRIETLGTGTPGYPAGYPGNCKCWYDNSILLLIATEKFPEHTYKCSDDNLKSWTRTRMHTNYHFIKIEITKSEPTGS